MAGIKTLIAQIWLFYQAGINQNHFLNCQHGEMLQHGAAQRTYANHRHTFPAEVAGADAAQARIDASRSVFTRPNRIGYVKMVLFHRYMPLTRQGDVPVFAGNNFLSAAIHFLSIPVHVKRTLLAYWLRFPDTFHAGGPPAADTGISVGIGLQLRRLNKP